MCFGGGSSNGERVYLCNGYGKQTKNYHKCDSCSHDKFLIKQVIDGGSVNSHTGVESRMVSADCAKCGSSNFIDVID
jgi:predicted nucleic-acid-binding Zn-ribbon protein